MKQPVSVVRPQQGFEIFAHRGSSVLAPENTREAFALAVEFEADVLETDVRLSREGVVFVTHDASLERTTNGTGLVRSRSAAELSRLDAGYHFVAPSGESSRGRGIGLMTLPDLLRDFPATRINIDIKDTEDAAAAAVALAIASAGAENRVAVGSFHAPTLHHFRALAPEVATAATQQEVAALYFGRFLPGVRDRLSPRYRWLQIPPRWFGIPLASRAFIATARAHELETIYWTINDLDSMRRLRAKGASGIVTDRPDLAMQLDA